MNCRLTALLLVCLAPVSPVVVARAEDPARGIGASSLPEPWKHQDIGDVAVAGTAVQGDGTFTLTGTLDIWGKGDGCHFAYLPLVGDGAIVARVTAVENTNDHAKGGVMIRESLAADSRHVSMVVTAVDGPSSSAA